MRGLGEEIAVLDGIDLGAIPGYYDRGQVIDASAGANYSGGSSWPGNLPLTPSNAGLADVDLVNYYTKTGVIDASAGANYSGGSSWPGNLPLTPSNAGLAELGQQAIAAVAQGMEYMPISTLTFQHLINMMGGKINADGVWGKASAEGLVRAVVASGADEEKDIRAALNNIKAVGNGRTLLMPSRYVGEMVKYYIKMIAAPATQTLSGGLADGDLVNYYTRSGVIDASAGANYSGGSSWPGNLPLTPSNAGLAGDGLYEGRPVSMMDRDYGSSIGSLEQNGNIPGYYDRGQVIDASAGANYSGGSSWPGNLPLTPSNAGLAELTHVEPMDGIFDDLFKRRLFANQIPAFSRLASQRKLQQLRQSGLRAKRLGKTAEANRYGNLLRSIRQMRRNILNAVRQAA